MGQKVRKTSEEIQRKYNAAYRLRKKIGEKNFPKRSRIITSEKADSVSKIPAAKILLSEFGFIIKPLIFEID